MHLTSLADLPYRLVCDGNDAAKLGLFVCFRSRLAELKGHAGKQRLVTSQCDPRHHWVTNPGFDNADDDRAVSCAAKELALWRLQNLRNAAAK